MRYLLRVGVGFGCYVEIAWGRVAAIVWSLYCCRGHWARVVEYLFGDLLSTIASRPMTVLRPAKVLLRRPSESWFVRCHP